MAGGAVLLAYAVARGRTAPLRSIAGAPLLWAITAMASSQPLFFTGVDRTGVAVGTIVTIGSGPLLAGLLAWAVRREVPDRRWLAATAVALVGAVLLVSGGESAGIDSGGLGFALAAGVAWAVYLVAAKGLFESFPPSFMAGVVFAGSALLLSPFFFVADVSWLADAEGVATALWVGPLATALSYVWFSSGLRETPVAVAATLTLAEPLTAAILGMTLVDEPVLLTTILGIALIMSAIAVLTFQRRPVPA
jgi:DME family drug/metabolite transporter